MIAQIIFIVIGTYLLLIHGILGLGMNWGKAKRFTDKIGVGPARIIYSILGLAFLVYGILAIINPNLMPY